MSQQVEFKLMTDEHVPKAVAIELKKRDINAVRLIAMIREGTPDPEVLEYCHQNQYTLITSDERIRGHVDSRVKNGKEHSGVFIASQSLGSQLIGKIVEEIVFFDKAIKADAATLEDDVYNQIRYIK